LEEKKILLIGPYLDRDITKQNIFEQCEKMRLSPKLWDRLYIYYSSLPAIKEESYIFAMINTFCELIWPEGFNNCDITRDADAAFIKDGFTPKIDLDTTPLTITQMEKRYEFEKNLLSAVSQGNAHKAEMMLHSFSSLSFESRIPDELRNMKNYCIVMNTLFRKAAQEGGVHPIYIDKVSSDFAKRIESITSVSGMPEFMLELLRTYCRLVRRHCVKNFSPIIQKAIIKIESDLAGDLTLNALAKEANVSPNYFSALFKKEAGLPLTQYVNNKRVDYAKQLLKTTSLQIQTIAQHTGILDLHYFCRIFKSVTGKTPSEYRNNLTIS
jgi:YesN/AraC family two-component response regulator